MVPELDLRVSPRTVLQQTVEKLRLAIFSGWFQPGDRLVESQLCAKLGVSRPSLREALRSLQAERLIEIIPNRGPQIPTLSWEEATAIYEVRELLEVEAAGRCATRITDCQLRELKHSLLDFEQAALNDDSSARIATAARFYSIMLANCGNPVLEGVHQGLLARISVLRSRSMSLKGRAQKSFQEMSDIYEAIAARDSKASRRAARRHVLRAKMAAKTSLSRTSRAVPGQVATAKSFS